MSILGARCTYMQYQHWSSQQHCNFFFHLLEPLLPAHCVHRSLALAMLAFYLLLSAALLSGFQAIATSAQSGHGKLRQTTRDEIVKRSSRTQPKRATISNGLTW